MNGLDITRINRERLQEIERLNNFKCFDIGEILELPQDSKEYIKVQIGYSLDNITIQDPQIVYCMASNIVNNKAKYKVGDRVAIAYTDKPQQTFLQTKQIEQKNIIDRTISHNIANGIILFAIDPYNKDTNNYVQLINDLANIKIETLLDGENEIGEKITITNGDTLITSINNTKTSEKSLTIKQGETNIILDKTGKLSIQAKGQIKISNSMGGDLKTILDEINTKIIAMATSIDASLAKNDGAEATGAGWVVAPEAVNSYGNQASLIAQLLE